MILTCPECATSYFVDDSAIGAGRTVRCASCSASWRVTAEPPLELRSTPEEGAVGVVARIVDDDLLERPPAELPAEDIPRMYRARAEGERRMREAAVHGVIWAGMGAAVALALILLVVFRVDVVRAWPKTASAYQWIRMPVNPFGLQIEQVRVQPSLQDGRPTLQVSGVLRNIRAEPMAAPRLRITLLDAQGHKLAVKLASPGAALVPAGQARSFSVDLLDPPVKATGLDVDFADDPARPAPRPKLQKTSAHKPRLRPPAEPPAQAMVLTTPVQDARPLPASDPYALRRQ